MNQTPIEIDVILYIDGIRITEQELRDFINQAKYEGKEVQIKTENR